MINHSEAVWIGDEVWPMEYVQRQIVSTNHSSGWWVRNDVIQRAVSSFVPPPTGWIKLHMDGRFHRQSSLMSCGGLLRDHNGVWVEGFASFEGIGEVFLPELIAVIRGLTLA